MPPNHNPSCRSTSRVAPAALIALVTVTGSASAQFGFNGLKQECQLGGNPPTISFDTPTPSIANSFNWIVEVCNSQIGVYQRNGSLTWRNNIGGMPVQFGGCTQNVDSFFGSNPLALGATRIVDTKVLYDAANSRFCVIGMQQDSPFAPPGNPGLFVAWSNNDNPMPIGPCGNGGWRIWRTPVPNLGNGITYQPDFNGMGQTSTHVIWSGILQPVSQPASPSYTFYRYFRKSDLSQNPQPNPLPYGEWFVQRPTSEFLHAADSFDPGSNMVLVGLFNNSNLRLVTVNQANGSEIPFVLPVDVFIPATGSAPQSGGTSLDTIDGRIQSAVLRDGYLYCCHTVMDLNARHVVRWYQIALNTWPMVGGTPEVVQSGNVDLGGQVHAFMPALAVTAAGTVLVTYARSASNEFPSIAWSARRSFDPPGAMLQGGNNPGGILHTGNSAYTTSGTTSAGAFRWGDWGCAVVDTFNSDRLLVSGSYAQNGGTSCALAQMNHWRTWISTVLPNSGGQVVGYGTGFPGTGGVPSISAPPPRLNTTPPVTVTNSSGVPTLGMGLIGLSAVASPGMPTGFGGLFWVDPATATSLFFSMNPVDGQFNLVIPNDPAFISFPLFLQGAVFDNGAAQGVANTAGLQVIIGT